MSSITRQVSIIIHGAKTGTDGAAAMRQLTQGAQALTAKLKDYEAAVRQAWAEIDRQVAAEKTMNEELLRKAQRVEQAKAELRELAAANRELAVSEDHLRQTTDLTTDEITELMLLMERAGAQSSFPAFNTANWALENLGRTAVKTKGEVQDVLPSNVPPPPPSWDEAETDLEQIAQAGERAATAIAGANKAMASAPPPPPTWDGEELAQATAVVKEMGEETQKTATTTTQATKEMGAGFNYLKGAVTNAIAFGIMNQLSQVSDRIKQFVRESVEAFAEYEFELAKVAAQTPDLDESTLAQVKGQVLDLSATIAYLPNEVLPTLRKALNLGVAPGGLLGGIEDAALAAKVAGADLTETFVTAQTAVNAYGTDLIGLNKVLEQYMWITQNSNLEQQDLNQGMSQIINTAAEAGVSIEDVSAAIVTMSKQGDTWEEITSLLTNFFVQIQIPTTSLGQAFKDIAGTDFTSFMRSGHSLAEAMEMIDRGARKAGVSVIQLVGGQSNFYRDQQAGLATVELTGRHYADLAVNAEGSAEAYGLLNEAAEEVHGTLAESQAKTEAVVAASKIMIGEALEPQALAWERLKRNVLETVTAYFEANKYTFDPADRFIESRQDQIDDLKQLIDLQDQLTIKGVRLPDAGLSQKEFLAGALEERFNSLPQTEQNVKIYISALERLAAASDEAITPLITARDLWYDAQQAMYQGTLYATGGPQEDFSYHAEKAAAELENNINRVEPLVERWKAIFKEATDGDTFSFEIEGEVQDIRIAGVDTPETPKEWEDALIKKLGMPLGDKAMEFATEILMSGTVSVGPELAESYGRQVREIFVDGERLATKLAKEGLALPLTIDLEDREAVNEIRVAYESAIRAGKGLFADAEIRQAALRGEISVMEDLIPYWEQLAVAPKDYTNAVLGSASSLTALLKAQEELGSSDNESTLLEEQEALTEAQDKLKAAYIEMGVEAIVANRGATESTLDLMVAMGMMSEVERTTRVDFANRSLMMEEFGDAVSLLGLSAEAVAPVLEGLAEGAYKNSEAAIAAAEANQSYIDILSTGVSEEMADKMFAAQTQAAIEAAEAADRAAQANRAYYDQVAITGDTELTDKLFRQQVQDVEPEPYVIEIDAKTEAFDEKANAATLAMAEFVEGSPYTATVDADYLTLFDPAMKTVEGRMTTYETTVYANKPQALVDEAMENVNALMQAAQTYADTEYHAYIYTHNVQVYESEGEAPGGNYAGGGIIPRTGVYTVGEFGYEQVILPKGAEVIRNEDLGRGGGIQVFINAADRPEETGQALIRALRKQGFRP